MKGPPNYRPPSPLTGDPKEITQKMRERNLAPADVENAQGSKELARIPPFGAATLTNVSSKAQLRRQKIEISGR